MDPTKSLGDVMDEDLPGYVKNGIMLALVLGVIGGVGGAYFGHLLLDDGQVIIISAMVGSGTGLAFGVLVSGVVAYYMRMMWAAVKPANVGERTRLIGASGVISFDLYVTVHCTKNVYSTEGIFSIFGKKNDSYVEVRVGRLIGEDLIVQKNPVKTTCVSSGSEFEECFHFCISPTDDHIRFTLFDQDMFKDDVVGTCDVPIGSTVLSFPQNCGFRLQRDLGGDQQRVDMVGDQMAGNLVVSFSPGSRFQGNSVVKERNPFAFKSLQGTLKENTKTTMDDTGVYGTFISTKLHA